MPTPLKRRTRIVVELYMRAYWRYYIAAGSWVTMAWFFLASGR